MRSGGFAGLSETLAEVDADRLDPETARHVREAFEASGFATLPARLPGDPMGADMFRYTIEVEDGQGRRSVSYRQGNPNAALLDALIAVLRAV